MTAQCNLRCSYCYQTAKRPLRIAWTTLRAAIDLALQSHSPEIKMVFIGGEPLLEFPRIRRAVESTERNAPFGKRIRYAVATNGLLLTDAIADFLDEHDFELQLSFDGIARAQDFRQRGTFGRIDRLLDRLRDRHPALFRDRLCINAVLVTPAIPYFADSIRYLIGKGVGCIAVSPSFIPPAEWTNKGVRDLDIQFRRIYDDSVSYLKKNGQVPFCLFQKTAANNRSYTGDATCSVAGGKNLTVDVDGRVYGCVMLAESYQTFPSSFLKTRLAPLRMGKFQDSEFFSRYSDFPKAVRGAGIFHQRRDKYSSYGRCRTCRYRIHCFVCPVSIGYDPGNSDPRRIPDFICAFNRVSLKYRNRFPQMTDPLEKLSRFIESFPE